MSSKTDARLTPGQRLGRGLKYSAVGPVDVTRGAVGLEPARRASRRPVGNRRRLARAGWPRISAQAQDAIAQELAAAQEVVAEPAPGHPEARKPKRSRRPLVLAAVGVAVLAGGAVAFSIVRSSMQPEPSPLPPSVDVSPKP